MKNKKIDIITIFGVVFFLILIKMTMASFFIWIYFGICEYTVVFYSITLGFAWLFIIALLTTIKIVDNQVATETKEFIERMDKIQEKIDKNE